MTATPVEQSAPPISKYWDILERVLWTLLQTTTAGGLVAGWNQLTDWDISLAWVPVIAALLSAIKGELAIRFGNGTAATLPSRVEPIPADQVVVQQTESGVEVAGPASSLETGTPVVHESAIDLENPEPGLTPGQYEEDFDPSVEVEMPVGFDDGMGPITESEGELPAPTVAVDMPEEPYTPRH